MREKLYRNLHDIFVNQKTFLVVRECDLIFKVHVDMEMEAKSPEVIIQVSPYSVKTEFKNNTL